jgi:hypothetical protein
LLNFAITNVNLFTVFCFVSMTYVHLLGLFYSHGVFISV